MATPLEMPKSGNTVEECIISRWTKRKGDTVSVGDVVAEIETDKATFEITAPAAGMLLDTFFDEGALVPVFTTVAVIGRAGEDIDAFRPSRGRDSGVGIRDSKTTNTNHADNESPVARIPNPESQITPGAASPRARRLAAARGISLAGVAGTGPGGRIIERDIPVAAQSRPVDSAQGRPSIRPSTTRATIARRLRESLASTAQYTLHASANASGLLSLRTGFKEAARTGRAPDITINDLVMFCTIQALLEMPDLNAEFVDGAIVRHADVHIGFACDTPRGLVVPVVRNAQTLSLVELSRRLQDLAAKAIDGRISPDALSGATFTISNLGALGIESFTPVINAPQVAILGVGAIQPKPVRGGHTDGIVFIDAIALSLTCDHQVIDGAPGARFLRVLAEKIEDVEYDLIMRGS
jgi:pyruvate dehydrogenase E2 component (dihydrolipoamide acetyltransferase)